MKDYTFDATLEIESCRRASGEVFSMIFKNDRGWAVVLIDEDSGTLAIVSNHGKWIYRWQFTGCNPRALKDFLAASDRHGLSKKLSGDSDEFDVAYEWLCDGIIPAIQRELIRMVDERPKKTRRFIYLPKPVTRRGLFKRIRVEAGVYERFDNTQGEVDIVIDSRILRIKSSEFVEVKGDT